MEQRQGGIIRCLLARHYPMVPCSPPTTPSHCDCALDGFSDLYRNSLVWGGIPDTSFNAQVAEGLTGKNSTERPAIMTSTYGLMNAY
jgi:hypothetical protein